MILVDCSILWTVTARTCGFHPIEAGSVEATIGYWLAEFATGKGLVTRSARILIDHAFNELAISKINIPVAVENVSSRAVCERIGLDDGGIKENAEYLYGTYVDHILYFTTSDTWRS